MLFFGHTVGMLTPHFVYEPFMSAGAKQLMAMIVGGVAGVLGFIGLSACCCTAACRRAHPPQCSKH